MGRGGRSEVVAHESGSYQRSLLTRLERVHLPRPAARAAPLTSPYAHPVQSLCDGSLIVSAEVASALAAGEPVLALESTIISHGMPWPANHETALRAERLVRSLGAVPATVAILDGAARVGLSAQQLEHLAREGTRARKVSLRDVGLAIAQKAVGATTVSATAHLARAAGVHVFSTGGLGGVHRGGESSMDVSNDLDALAKIPIVVVCAGVKSVLDIPRTLEALETRGVPAAAFRTDEFPAFYSHVSGAKAPLRVDELVDVARAQAASTSLGLLSAFILAVPPPPAAMADGERVRAAVEVALAECESNGITGRDVTPFLLEAVRKHTSGVSLKLNVELYLNNVGIGAQLAAQVAGVERERKNQIVRSPRPKL